MASLSPDLTQARFMLCGHPAPLLIQHGSVVELDAEVTPALAVEPGSPTEPSSVALDGEWGLLLYTDGLVEGSKSPGSRTRLGVDDLSAHLETLVQQGVPRRQLAPELLAEAERRNGGLLTDDVAVLLVGTPSWWC